MATRTAPTLTVTTADYHTAGEPFRIVTGGVPPLEGADVPARRRFAAEQLDHVRQLLVNEPRGHADMYGCFVTEPDDGDGDLGVVFFHNAGYSTACGHGTIALVTWALESGVVPVAGAQTTVTVDAPSGRLVATATVDGDRVRNVRFTNVASYLEAAEVPVTIGDRRLRPAVAFGGAFYAVLPAADVDAAVRAPDLPALIAHGRSIKAAIEARRRTAHPDRPDVRDIYGVIFTDPSRWEGGALHQRNVAIFADGEVDRSPTGSGVSARLALLDATGTLPRGAELVTTGVADEAFTGRVTGDARVGDRRAVITEVGGAAYRTGTHEFTLDPDDPLGTGFLLR